MKKALITGATGFIGQHLIQKLLKENVFITLIVRENEKRVFDSKIKVVHCDLENILALSHEQIDQDIDVYYHLAWAGTAGPERANYTLQMQNVKYTLDGAMLSKKLGIKKFVTTGTISEHLVEEAFTKNYTSENLIYGIAKHSCHHMLHMLSHKHQINYVWAQLSNIYGEHNTSGNIVSYTINELLAGRKPQFSKALQIYDLAYVGDIAHVLYMIGFHPTKKSFYFLGSGTPKILREYLLTIKEVFGDNASIGIGERPEDGIVYHESWFDVKDLVDEFHYRAEMPFELQIKKLIDDLKKEDN
jgi:UDP-glucose 4-epimerase